MKYNMFLQTPLSTEVLKVPKEGGGERASRHIAKSLVPLQLVLSVLSSVPLCKILFANRFFTVKKQV